MLQTSNRERMSGCRPHSVVGSDLRAAAEVSSVGLPAAEDCVPGMAHPDGPCRGWTRAWGALVHGSYTEGSRARGGLVPAAVVPAGSGRDMGSWGGKTLADRLQRKLSQLRRAAEPQPRHVSNSVQNVCTPYMGAGAPIKRRRPGKLYDRCVTARSAVTICFLSANYAT